MKKEFIHNVVGVNCFLQVQDGRFLMQLRDNKPSILYPNHWVFIGGAVEKNETPEEALFRELKEELGFEPTSIEKVLVLYGPSGAPAQYCYYASLNQKAEDLIPIEKEGQKNQLFTLEEIEKLNLAFNSKELIPILKWYLILREDFKGRS